MCRGCIDFCEFVCRPHVFRLHQYSERDAASCIRCYEKGEKREESEIVNGSSVNRHESYRHETQRDRHKQDNMR